MDKTWINTKAASKILGVSPQRIRIYISEGRLPATKIGKQWLIDPDRLGDVKVKAPGRPVQDPGPKYKPIKKPRKRGGRPS